MPGSLSNKLKRGAKERKRIWAIRRTFATVRRRQRENINRIPDLEERKARLRRTREYSLGNKELLDKAIENLRSNGIEVEIAATKEEAISLILNRIGDEKLVVKAKSNTTKEIGLTGALEAKGIEAIETDIGDRIIQLAGDQPSHTTGPASHLSRNEIAKVLSRHFGRDIAPDPGVLTRTIRDEVSSYLKEANIGITGANAITAEEGAILLVHNEGNILELMMRPGRHIILAGIDKIYPNLEEAMNMAKLQTFYATGALITAFLNIIGGSSSTADIEKKIFRGIHGPETISLILLDNKRSDILESDFRELLYCIGCGECLLQCPVYQVYGGKFGYEHNLGGRGVIYSSFFESIQKAKKRGLDYCVTCGRCKKHCPVGIDVPHLIKRLRQEYGAGFPEPHLEGAYRFVESHLRLLFSALRLELLALISSILRLEEEGV
ncbi:MAG: lactate utilization protein [Dehalococcoidia bacterium]|nr:lactate utilization protein [Dehalococcoidia bacterium]